MNNIKISVLVPVYNVEKYLKECLDSIVNQTLSDIEVIIINDGSTDSSLDIIKNYANNDSRIKVIDKPNSGYGDSMNRGLKVACGEFVAIVEPDDFIKKEMFEDLYNLALQNDADIAKGEYYDYFSKDKQTRKTGRFARFKTGEVIDIKKHPKLTKIQPSIWSAIYKREFLNKNNINFLTTPGAAYQDTSFAFKTLCLGKIILSSNAYYYYRKDNENSSVRASDKVFLICLEYDEIDKFLDNNKNIKEIVNTQKLIKQYERYFWNLKRIDEKFRKDFIEKFSETFKKYYNQGEIQKEFYTKINKKEFLLLINDKDLFKTKIEKQIENSKNNDERRKMFSIRINSSRISIVLFGRQIVELG